MKKISIIFLSLLGLYSLGFAGFGGDSLGSHKANKNLNMREHDVTNAGTVRANEFDGNFSTGVPHIIECRAGENLAKGDVVYRSGVVGDKMRVSKADFDDPAKDQALGFAFETASNGQDILVIMNGMLHDIDTSGRAVGDVYLWETGDYTGITPTSGVVQDLGELVRVHASQGVIYVHVHPVDDYMSGGIGQDIDIRMGDQGGRIIFEDGQDNVIAILTKSSMTLLLEVFGSTGSFSVLQNEAGDMAIEPYSGKLNINKVGANPGEIHLWDGSSRLSWILGIPNSIMDSTGANHLIKFGGVAKATITAAGDIYAKSFNGDGSGLTETGFTTHYFTLTGGIADVYKSTSVPIDYENVPTDIIITGVKVACLYASTCASTICEIKTSTGTNTLSPIVWTSVAIVELSTAATESSRTTVTVDADEDLKIGYFVNFVSEIGGEPTVGVKAEVRYHVKEQE